MHPKSVRVKISCKHPDVSSYPILMTSYNKKLGHHEALLEDGTFVEGRRAEDDRRKLARHVISLREPYNPKDPGDRRKRCFGFLDFVPVEFEHQIESLEDQKANLLNRLKYQFLKRAEFSIVLDENGENCNENLGNSPLIVIEDENSKIRKTAQQNELMGEYLSVLTTLKSDPDAMYELAYAANIPNIHLAGSVEALYNKLAFLIQNNAVLFGTIYKNKNRAFISMVNRAIYEPVNGNETIISTEGSYYKFNGQTIANGIDEVYSFFQSNPGALKALEQKMGHYIKRVPFSKLSEPIVVGEIQRELQPVRDDIAFKNMQEARKEAGIEMASIVNELSLITKITPEDWSDYQKKVNDLKTKYQQRIENASVHIDDLDNTLRKKKNIKRPYSVK